MAVQARSFDYAVSLDETWDARSDRGGGVLAGADEASWTPEHLVLTGLARCTLTSLRYYCVRENVALTSSATARSNVRVARHVTRERPAGRRGVAETTLRSRSQGGTWLQPRSYRRGEAG